MAGDWIKMRVNLWDDPRVAWLCEATGKTEAAVVGGLYWLWTTADQHTEDGLLHGLTTKSINRKTAINGFAEALLSIDWLGENDGVLCIPRFDEHNGASAKNRAQTAKRVAQFKRKGNGRVTQTPLPENENAVSTALPREEKIKEVNNNTPQAAFDARKTLTEIGVDFQVADDWLQLRKRKRAAVTATAIAGIEREARKAGMSLNDALATCCKNGWQGFSAEWVGADGASIRSGASSKALFQGAI